MKRTSWLAIAMIAILGCALLYIRGSHRASVSDEAEILAVLDKGRTAVEQKDLRTALSLVSPDYSDSAGMNSDRLRAYIVQAFRANEKYQVRISDQRVRLQGDLADISALLSVSGRIDNEYHDIFDDQIHVTMRRQHSKRWLIIPVTAWKVVNIAGLPSGLEE